MTKKTAAPAGRYRHQFVHGDDADFIAYQRHLRGVWHTLSRWMIPRTQNG